MWSGCCSDGPGGKMDPLKANPNLGGPSHTALEKRVSGYTAKSGVIKPWLASLIHLVNDGATPLIHTPELDVFGLSLQNDGTALKPSLQFDPAKHLIVGLQEPMSFSDISLSIPTFLFQSVLNTSHEVERLEMI